MSEQLQRQVATFLDNLEGQKATTVKHFNKIWELFCEDYKTQVRPPQDCKVLNWGKYKGKTIIEILKFDKNYINWMKNCEYTNIEQKVYIQSLLEKPIKTEE